MSPVRADQPLKGRESSQDQYGGCTGGSQGLEELSLELWLKGQMCAPSQ